MRPARWLAAALAPPATASPQPSGQPAVDFRDMKVDLTGMAPCHASCVVGHSRSATGVDILDLTWRDFCYRRQPDVYLWMTMRWLPCLKTMCPWKGPEEANDTIMWYCTNCAFVDDDNATARVVAALETLARRGLDPEG